MENLENRTKEQLIEAVKNLRKEISGKTAANEDGFRYLADAPTETTRERERQFKELFEKSGDANLIIDNGNFVDCNQAAFIMLKYKSKEEILKGHPSQFSPTVQSDGRKSSKKSDEMMEAALKNGTHRFEWDYLQSDGNVLPVEVLLTSIVNSPDNKIIHAVWRDISSRKEAEQEIITAKEKAEESERKFRAITNQAIEGITVAYIEGNYVFVNPAFCQMSGYTEEELFKMTVFDMIAKNQSHSSFYDSRDNLEGDPVRVNLQRKDGTEYLAEIISNIIIIDNKKLVLGTIRDITDKIKKEKELEMAKERAQESDRLKSAFLTNMSHEIRTPMNGILGFTNLLKEPELTGDEQQAYIGIIEKSGDRMLNTINNLMDISMIESGQVKVSNSKVNVNEQIDDLYGFFKPEANKKELEIICRNSLPEQEAIIKTDPQKFYAILTNLIKNAIKYTQKGIIEFGYRIFVETHGRASLQNTGRASLQNTGRASLQFYVKDTGIGIPKDRQQAIFDRFVQADIEDKQVFEGSGLGLSISKAYVEMLGGKIWVESVEGQGSQFYFSVPYNHEPEIRQGGESENLHARDNIHIKGFKILISDDEETADKHLTLVLKNIAEEILHAKTGVETIKLCRENPDINLVLMDIRMPEMFGYQATREIRKFNKNVIIIAQTAYAMAGDREKALQAGCNDYISKPINKDELMEIIKKHCNSES